MTWLSTHGVALRDDNLEKFRKGGIVGRIFLECNYDIFRKEVRLDFGIAMDLDILVKRIRSEGLKSKFHLRRKNYVGNYLVVSQGAAEKPGLPTLPPRKCIWTARSRLNGLLFTPTRYTWVSIYTRQLATLAVKPFS